MLASLRESLSKLVASSVAVSEGNGFPAPGQASVALHFADGTILQAEFWRLVEDGRPIFGSFDHRQTYGRPTAIDAIQLLQERLAGETVTEALFYQATGDFLFRFTHDTMLEIWNVTGYEVWEIRFPDGTGEYSNYAK